MKSIFMLCEYGIDLDNVIFLDSKGVTFDDIYNDIHCLDQYFGDNSREKDEIERRMKYAVEDENEYSLYDLAKYGLSLNMIQRLVLFRDITIEDINDGKLYTYRHMQTKKIMDAYNAFIEDRKIDFSKIHFPKMLKIIEKAFGIKVFQLDELKIEVEKAGYSTENFEDVVNELVRYKKVFIVENGYRLPYSVYELENYGLSKEIIDKVLIERHIKFDDINETMRERYHIAPARCEQILEAHKKMVEDLHITKELYKDDVYKIIKENKNSKVITIEEMKSILKKRGYDLGKYDTFLNELYNQNKITYENCGYRLTYPKLIDELEKLKQDEKKYDMVIKKLSGYTLEQIGNEYSVTRERVRQILAKEMKKIHHVEEEEQYAEYIENYDFKEELFCKLFNQEQYVYFFLREKYKKGETKPSELLDDNTLTSEQIEILRREYNVIRYNDENIVADTLPIIMAYLKKIDKRVEYEEVMENYNQIIKEYSLSLEPLTEKDFRNIDSRLTRTDLILDTIGRSFRYYNCNDIEEQDIKELKEMFNIEPGIYSSELFFKDNPILMKKLDIRDEYELHNLCKKVLGRFDEGIIYSRMPDIFIKCDNKLEFIDEQIHELAPIKLDDFVDYMYKNYGHKESSLKAYIINNFNSYINIDTLICSGQEFTEEQFNIMNDKLTEDIYSIATIKKMLTDYFNVDDFKLLNSLNLSKLGYRLRGNYIMKNNIISLENYLRDIILSRDYYEISPEMRKIGSTFSSYLYKFIYDKILFKISDEKYITIKKLNEIGINIEDIDDFIEKIEKTIPENEYFNLYTLNTDFSNKLLDNNFPDCFYENLIMIIPEVKSFTMKNNTLFIKTNDSATREKFINSFIKDNKKYIKEISNEIHNKFNIEVEDYYIKQFINRKKFYLDSSTDCVYESREKYEEEINQWNILKYID